MSIFKGSEDLFIPYQNVCKIGQDVILVELNLTEYRNFKTSTFSEVSTLQYTSNSGDSGGIVYALTKATNTRYTVGINLGSITYNGITYGACIKAYLINQTFGLTRY